MEHAFSVNLDDNRTIWLTEISRQAFEEQDVSDLDSDCGLFVVLEDVARGTFDILAKVASQAAGRALLQVLCRSASHPIGLAT